MKCNDNLVNKLNFEDVLLDTLPNPVYYKDIHGRFIGCNTCFSQLINTPKEEIIGKLAYDFFPKSAADRHRPIDIKIMQTLESYTDNITFPMPDGEIKYFTLNKGVYLSLDGNVGGIVCVMNDITQSEKEHQVLIQQNKMAAMGEMLGAIAHQWHEPLVEVSAQVQKIKLFYGLNNLNQQVMNEFVTDTMTQTQYMSETLNAFRNFLKPSNTKHKFELKNSIQEIFDIIGKQIFYSDIKVLLKYDKDKVYINGYKNELQQVLLNIINNAKYKIINKNKLEEFKGVIKLRIVDAAHCILIDVEDNAGEIEPNIANHIFEPFFTTKPKGTGYGLYIAKLIIEEKMNGKIKIENQSGKVIFKIKIPKV